MYRTRVILAVVAVLVLSACRGLAPGADASSPEPRQPAAVAAPKATPQPTPCALGGGVADVAYANISELARLADAISIAEVTSVGDLQYTTESGERPSCDYIRDAQGVFSVGRMIELREQRNVAGNPKGTRTFTYWLRGGSLGSDEAPPHHFGLETPEVGDRMLAFLMAEPGDIDVGSGVLQVDSFELFEIGRGGRIVTPNSQEEVTTDNVDAMVDEEVPAPSGG